MLGLFSLSNARMSSRTEKHQRCVSASSHTQNAHAPAQNVYGPAPKPPPRAARSAPNTFRRPRRNVGDIVTISSHSKVFLELKDHNYEEYVKSNEEYRKSYEEHRKSYEEYRKSNEEYRKRYEGCNENCERHTKNYNQSRIGDQNTKNSEEFTGRSNLEICVSNRKPNCDYVQDCFVNNRNSKRNNETYCNDGEINNKNYCGNDSFSDKSRVVEVNCEKFCDKYNNECDLRGGNCDNSIKYISGIDGKSGDLDGKFNGACVSCSEKARKSTKRRKLVKDSPKIVSKVVEGAAEQQEINLYLGN